MTSFQKVPSMIFCFATTLLWAAGPIPVAADPVDVRWKSKVTPADLLLTCKKNDVIIDVQTRAELVQRYGLVGKVDEVGRLISEMREAGYVVSGELGNETLERELPFRVQFEKPVRFSTEVQTNGVTLFVHPVRGKGRLVVDRRIAQYLTPENTARMDSIFEAWKIEIQSEVATIRQSLDGRFFPFSESELSRVARQAQGEVSRIADLDFCQETHPVTVHARWKRVVDEGLGR